MMFEKYGKIGGALQKMITKKEVYTILILCSSLFLFSCSSSNSSSPSIKEKGGDLVDSKGRKIDTRTGRVVHVEVIDSERKGELEAYKDHKAQIEYLEIFKKKRQWSKMEDSAKEIRRYKDMSLPQIRNVLRGAGAEETTLIIEALTQRGESGVGIIAGLLTDKRKAKFFGREPLFWYEKKNQPPEPVEIRVFAASQLADLLTTKPKGVIFDYHDLQTSDLGTVKVMYAIQGDYALNKDDLCAVWLEWWTKFKSDFSSQ